LSVQSPPAILVHSSNCADWSNYNKIRRWN